MSGCKFKYVPSSNVNNNVEIVARFGSIVKDTLGSDTKNIVNLPSRLIVSTVSVDVKDRFSIVANTYIYNTAMFTINKKFKT